jgi:diguanylate cyclase (GGDEF)-like protein
VTHAALWLSGLAVGVVAGWLAGARLAGRRHAGARADTDDPSEPLPPYALRAADAAADLPLGARLDVLARLLADRSAERVGLPCAVVLREVEGGPIVITTVSAGFDARLVGIGVDPDSAAGRAVTEGLPIVALADEPVVQAGSRDRRRPLRGGVAVPIRSGSYVEGAVLALGEPQGPPSEAIARLEALVRRFAPVLGPAHAVAIAERRAATDELTGLANRRAFKAALGTGDPARSALILLDLDRFKAVNDTLGHAAGDAALKHLAQLLKAAVRAGDIAARIGGEEFAVWLPGAELPLALEIAERLRALVAERPFRFGGAEHPFTISCGVSACPVPITHPDNLMAAADGALYRAKREGRNRVVASTGKDG